MAKEKNIAAFTLGTTAVIVLSKLLGFIRELTVAAYYGTGVEADAYTAAYSTYYIPILLFTSCIASTLAPQYLKLREKSEKKANRFISNLINLFAIFGLITSVVMLALARPIITVFYHGFTPEQSSLTVELLRIMLPGLMFAVAALVMSSTLSAQKHFKSAQLLGFPLSVCTIVAAVLFSRIYGVRAIAWGVLCTGALQLLVQIWALRKSFSYHFIVDPAEPSVRALLSRALPAILTMGATEFNSLIDKSMASGFGEGSLSAMSYAFRIVVFVNGIFISPIVSVMFTKMSESAVKSGSKAVVRLFRRCSEVICAILMPVTIIAAISSREIIQFAFMRGQFSETSLVLTSGIFAMYICGELFFAMRSLINNVFNSLEDTKTPMYVALIMMCINILLNILFSKIWGLNGLALSTSVSGAASVCLLFYLLKRKVGETGLHRALPEYIKSFLASVVVGIYTAVLHGILPKPTAFIPTFFYLALLAGSALAVYVGIAVLLRSRSIRRLGKLLGDLSKRFLFKPNKSNTKAA